MFLLVLFILFYSQRHLYVVSWLPSVVTFWVALSLDKVLQLFLPPMMLVAPDGLDFILFSIINMVRWGS